MSAEIPSCPRHLAPAAKREWRRLTHQLYLAGLLTRVDRAALAGYCQAWAHWSEAEAKVAAQGAVIEGEKGLIVNPWLKVSNMALDQVRRFAVEFGMTPSSRSRVKAQPPQTEQSLAEILFEGVGSAVNQI